MFYNFIRKHQTIDYCLFGIAISELKLKGENKWLELIQISNNKFINSVIHYIYKDDKEYY